MHAVQVIVADCAEYLPAAQAVQPVDATDAEYLPAAQAAQALEYAAPVAVE